MSKVAEWNEKNSAALAADYQEKGSDSSKTAMAFLADKYGTTVASVRGKLVSMKVYQPLEKTATAKAETAPRKINIVDSVSEQLTGEKGNFASLEKASKADLDALLAAIQTNEAQAFDAGSIEAE